MSDDVTINVEGLRELEQQLVALVDVGSPKTLARALRPPMQQVLSQAKALVPKRTGALHDALGLVVRGATAARASMSDTLAEVGIRISKRKSGTVGTSGGEKVNPRRYWHLVEFGTSRTAARPFIRPAFDGSVDAMLHEFKGRLQVEIAKLGRKGRR